jgi:hypothetical protein
MHGPRPFRLRVGDWDSRVWKAFLMRLQMMRCLDTLSTASGKADNTAGMTKDRCSRVSPTSRGMVLAVLGMC